MECMVDTRGSRLRVRAGPGTRHRVLGSLEDGERVRIVGHRGAWGELSTRGWVHTAYLVDAQTELRGRIAQLLRSRECQGINFEMAGTRVTGRLYGRVASHVLDTSWPYKIRITTNPAHLPISRTTGRRVAGMYTMRPTSGGGENTLLLRGDDFLARDEDRATVVHECAHIIYDVLRVPCVGMDMEAAAYLAETWYLIDLRGPNPSAAKPAVLEVAREVWARSGGPGSPPVRVTQAERHQLHRALVDIGYRWERTGNYGRPDGLQRHLE